MSINSRFKAIQIIDQRKTFCKQIIPESSCERKGTVDMDINLPSRNGNRKIIIITSKPPLRIEKWNQFGHFR